MYSEEGGYSNGRDPTALCGMECWADEQGRGGRVVALVAFDRYGEWKIGKCGRSKDRKL